MKSLLSALAALLLSFSSIFATTYLVPGTVTGHWDLSGSPYIVNGNIAVPAGSVLRIDPGVQVIFAGYYRLTVNGNAQLIARGTASQPIVFKAQDTTGWYNDVDSVGGWAGIVLNDNTAPSFIDSTTFQYCDITGMKMGGAYHGLFYLARKMKVDHCNFYHNRSMVVGFTNFAFGAVIELNNGCEIDHCKLYDNYANYGVVWDYSHTAYSYIHNSEFYNNYGGGNVIEEIFANIIIENNDIHHNTSQEVTSTCAIFVDGGSHATIRHNKVHDNISSKVAAISANSGTVDIDGNYIYNNSDTSGTCGATDGGGGIRITTNSNPIFKDSTFYIVRNNVIANNYTNLPGGGILMRDCNAEIMNNTIVNNLSDMQGAAISVGGAGLTVHFKNNIIYGNKTTGSAGYDNSIAFGAASLTYSFDYNYIPYSFTNDVWPSSGLGIVRVADTAHNIVSTSPGFRSPALVCGNASFADSADYSLLSSSPCIDKGDTISAYTTAVDFKNNTRINNNKIDMGAIEYKDTTNENTGIANVNQAAPGMLVYPNPARKNIFVILPEAQGKIELNDIMGKTVLTKNVTVLNNYINLSNIAPGIYFIIWTTGNTKMVSRLSVQ